MQTNTHSKSTAPRKTPRHLTCPVAPERLEGRRLMSVTSEPTAGPDASYFGTPDVTYVAPETGTATEATEAAEVTFAVYEGTAIVESSPLTGSEWTYVEADASEPDTLTEAEAEAEALALQQAMDRRSKLMSTLSNLLKKSSDAASSITQNIK